MLLERPFHREPDEPRPKTRGDCVDGERPCRWLGCTMHLAVSVNAQGGLIEDPRGLDGMTETCALDVAARGGATLEEVGEIMGVVRERVRQIEERACSKLRTKLAAIVQ